MAVEEECCCVEVRCPCFSSCGGSWRRKWGCWARHWTHSLTAAPAWLQAVLVAGGALEGFEGVRETVAKHRHLAAMAHRARNEGKIPAGLAHLGMLDPLENGQLRSLQLFQERPTACSQTRSHRGAWFVYYQDQSCLLVSANVAFFCKLLIYNCWMWALKGLQMWLQLFWREGLLSKNSPQFLSGGLEALRTRSCSVFSQHPVKQIQNQIRFRSLLKVWFSLGHVQRSLERTSWPRGSVHQWTPLVKKEALPRACSAPPTLSRIHSPGRCSSPQTSPCGSGRSSGPAHSAQRSSSPRGSWWCRSRSARTREITPSEREEKSRNTWFFKCVLIQDGNSNVNLEIRRSQQQYQYLGLLIRVGNIPCFMLLTSC